MKFIVNSKDAHTGARCGELFTLHGTVRTPVFMPVATRGAVKMLTGAELADAGVEMIISNAYHLYLRPGKDVVERAGGLHKFMGWGKSIATDSGGFQVFSLAGLRKIREEGVEFRSHIDGSRHMFTPENVVDLQISLGSDIMMPLDECVHYPATRDYVEDSVGLTLKWLERAKKHFISREAKSALFAIVQGSTYKDLRERCSLAMAEMDMDGYALGGIGVGEPVELIHEITNFTSGLLPQNKVKYLMGVGTPPEVLEAIAGGIDMFDCVVPTRNGRNGQAFTDVGELQLKNARFKDDTRPIDEKCGCYACRNYSRGYLRHMFLSGEVLGPRMVSLHNISFYADLIRRCRVAIEEGVFGGFKKSFLAGYAA